MRHRTKRSRMLVVLTSLLMVMSLMVPVGAAPADQASDQGKANAADGNGRGDGLPPGLEKRDELPPGLQGRGLPPGLQEGTLFELTVLHHNDGESALLPDGDIGGVARFATLVERERADALSDETVSEAQGVVLISAGDNYLASPALSASRTVDYDPFYDAVAMDIIGYDAVTIGNHEFDLGPDVLDDFIAEFGAFNPAPAFISANLVTTGTVLEGDIAPYTVVIENGRQVGIVGATTPELNNISSPGDVDVITDVAGEVQAAIDELTDSGVEIIVLSSHLQSVNNDVDLVGQLSGVDIAIAGGGDELLANAEDLLIPGDEASGSYPITASAADGATVPIVTAPGDYLYLGRLDARFDAEGILVDFDGGPVRNVGEAFDDGVAPDPTVDEEVTDPVSDFVAGLETTVIGTSESFLNAERPDIRVGETNMGNLMADSVAYSATQAGLAPDVAIQNGGGIRASIDTGPITLAETFTTAPFLNFVVVFDSVSPEQLKALLERGVSAVEDVSGRFPHVSGMSYTFDLSGTAQVQDEDGNITTQGSRIVDVTLDDGTQIVSGGAVVGGAPSVSLATIDFLANGGDGYPFPTLGLTTFEGTGTTYQQALQDYIVDGLGGVVSDDGAYAPGGEGRITQVG